MITTPREFMETDNAKKFLNFNDDVSTFEGEVQAGQFYERTIDGKEAYRIIYRPTCIHPAVTFSTECVGYAVDFFEQVFGAPNPLPASNQIWPWNPRACRYFYVFGKLPNLYAGYRFLWQFKSQDSSEGCTGQRQSGNCMVFRSPCSFNDFFGSMLCIYHETSVFGDNISFSADRSAVYRSMVSMLRSIYINSDYFVSAALR